MIRFYLLSVWLNHDVTIDEDGTYDGGRKEAVREHVDGDPPYGVERREDVHGLFRGEPEYRPALGHDDERLLVRVVGIDVADGGRRELHRKFAVASRQVVA